METIEKKYEKAFEQLASIQPIFPEQAKRQMAEMVEEIFITNKHIDSEICNGRLCGQSAGFIAEDVAKETYNLDAILKGKTSRAFTDRDSQWKNYELNGKPLGSNDVPDIIITDKGKVVHSSQSKFYSTAEETTRQMSKVENGKIKYEEMDSLLGPTDQVNSTYKNVPGEADFVKTTSIEDHANAKADAIRDSDPLGAKAYEQTAKKVRDKISYDDASSKPISKSDAELIANGDKSKHQQIESEYQTKSTLKQMKNAAIGAAAMSAVVSGSINTIRYVQLARDGKITAEEATIKIIGETVASAADSAIKASANTGVQSLMVRFGSEEAAMQILTNQGLKSMLKTNAVTVGVVCAIDLVKDLVSLGMGNITKDQFYERQGKGVLTTASGVFGGGLGTAGAAGIVTAFGGAAGTLTMTIASVIGGISGGLIAGLAMSFAIENGIERPYRDLVRNTRSLNEATSVLQQVSQNIFHGQVLFGKYLEADIAMEHELKSQMRSVDMAGQRAADIISQI